MAENILNIESSTGICSVSITSGNQVIAFRESRNNRSHAAVLTVFIDEMIRETGLAFTDLSAVAVSRGPGSYTGLRIGVSAAKGICYAAGLPLIAVNTLELMVRMVNNTHSFPGTDHLLCPMIDARRMEVYMALFDAGGRQKSEISAEIITGDSFPELLNEKSIYFFGDGAGKCEGVVNNSNAFFIPDIYPSAGMMAGFSGQALQEGKFEDTAYFVPFYLKDFIATTPKNKIF
jgi:tRNA threonylcarbamoyladenosine biosynthesis protein TsaB